MNKKIIYASVLVLSIGLGGCSSNTNQTSNEQNKKMQDQITVLQKQNQQLEKEIKNQQNQSVSSKPVTEAKTTPAESSNNLGFTLDDLKTRLNSLGWSFHSTDELQEDADKSKILSEMPAKDGLSSIVGDIDPVTKMVKDYGFDGPTTQSIDMYITTIAAASTTNLGSDEGKSIYKQLCYQLATDKNNLATVVKGNIKYTMKYDTSTYHYIFMVSSN